MKKVLCFIWVIITSGTVIAQPVVSDTAEQAKVTIDKDPRLDLLAKVQVDIANANAKMAARFTKGYRLFLLKTDDRDYAMKVRAFLLQTFPEEKVIMSYQAPFIKMKFGNFVEKEEAEKLKKQILKSGVIKGGIYVVPDTIELKPDKEVKDPSKE